MCIDLVSWDLANSTWQLHQLVSEFLHVLATCGHIMNYAQDFLALSLLQSPGFWGSVVRVTHLRPQAPGLTRSVSSQGTVASPDPPLPTVVAAPRVRAGSERGRPHLLPAEMLTFQPRMDPAEERLRLEERRPAGFVTLHCAKTLSKLSSRRNQHSRPRLPQVGPSSSSAGCASGSGPRCL